MMNAKNKKSNRSGFVLLFAVTISAIILAIALGVANIALKEIKFSTSARDTNNAFFAADTGIEYVLLIDKTNETCGLNPNCSYTLSLLGGENQSCAYVTIVKTLSSKKTTIVSKGYNIGDASCLSSNPDRIQREIKITY